MLLFHGAIAFLEEGDVILFSPDRARGITHVRVMRGETPLQPVASLKAPGLEGLALSGIVCPMECERMACLLAALSGVVVALEPGRQTKRRIEGGREWRVFEVSAAA
jgi:hypothetical protein